MSKDDKVLDPYQAKIVKEEKSFLAIAGAGCGKTFTIIKKIQYYLQKGYDINSILVIAYTRLNALEIKDRLSKEGIDLKVHTFHSLAYSVVDYDIITDDDIKYLNMMYLEDNIISISKLCKKINRNGSDIIKEFANLINVIKVNEIEKSKINKRMFICKEYYYLFKEYYAYYERCLADSCMIDFNDLITLAKGKITAEYKCIFIDEFQDISYSRYMLVDDIVKRNNAKLYCFGDDYQSIYRFSGSKIEYFLNFEKLSGINNVLYILETYRNSQELLDIATTFIQKNKKQIKKRLHSTKSIEYPIVILYYDYEKAFGYIFKDINNEDDVLILGRYSYCENIVKRFCIFLDGYYYFKSYKNKITFLTIHKAKGLESDNVIILEMINTKTGFPSKKKEINLENSHFDFYYAEERRLFYVAITRTKNKCYLITSVKEESEFIKEIKRYNHVLIIY